MASRRLAQARDGTEPGPARRTRLVIFHYHWNCVPRRSALGSETAVVTPSVHESLLSQRTDKHATKQMD
ncbi:hypothetical protein DO73_4660 [Burkholderia pseudomallei]|nr:hypothetical protein DO73_4660 [Burkholderia pseudomallei]